MQPSAPSSGTVPPNRRGQSRSEQNAFESFLPAAEHGPAVRDEHALYGKVEQRPERAPQVGVRALRTQPALGAEPQLVVGRARLRAGAEQDVADGDCFLLRQPVDELAVSAVSNAREPPGSSVSLTIGSVTVTPRFDSAFTVRADAQTRAPSRSGVER